MWAVQNFLDCVYVSRITKCFMIKINASAKVKCSGVSLWEIEVKNFIFTLRSCLVSFQRQQRWNFLWHFDFFSFLNQRVFLFVS